MSIIAIHLGIIIRRKHLCRTSDRYSRGDDIVANNDSISFSTSKSYQHDGSTIVISDGQLVAEGIKLKNFPEFLTAINSMLRTAPGPSDYNAFSLGYIKNGTKVWPASCQNIPLALETSVNFNESGCVVL
jgi:hypothetical protein